MVSFLPFSCVHLCFIYLLVPVYLSLCVSQSVCFSTSVSCVLCSQVLCCSWYSELALRVSCPWGFLLPVSLSSILVCSSFSFVFLFSLLDLPQPVFVSLVACLRLDFWIQLAFVSLPVLHRVCLWDLTFFARPQQTLHYVHMLVA